MRMNTRHMAAAVSFVAAICFFYSTAFAAERGANDGPAEPAEARFLREAESKIDRVYLMTSDSLEAQLERALFDPEPILDQAGDIARKGPEDLRARAVALMAKIKRIAGNDPEEALETVARVLLGKERGRTWEKAFAEARDAALDKWKEEYRQARRDRVEPPAKPERVMFAPFPSVAEWTIDSNNLRCAVEAGLCLLAMNDRQAALRAFKTLGQRHGEDVIAILSEEGGGDAFMMPGGYAKAVDLYSHAIQVCRHCIGYMQADPFGEIRHFQRRIERKLAEARRLADIESYGPGYCAYRRAQHLRCTQRDYPNAFLAYEDLAEDFPKTVFASASEAYRLKILLELSEPGNEEKAEKAIAEAEKAYREAERALKAAEREKAIRKNRDVRDALRETLKKQYERLKRLKSIPLGKRAAREAANRERELLRDEFALYRGEMLVDLATHAFERELDPREAGERYEKAWTWLEKVNSVDAALDAFDVPEKARKVSRPPQREIRIDRMGNVDNERIDPSMIVNRKTCPFYLDDLRERCALAIGFLHFVNEDREQALAWYARVPELDEGTKYLERQGEWTNYTRLKWGAEHGYLNAYPEELKIYKKRLRFVVLMADFYYCTQRFGKAREIAGRMLAGEFGRLDPRQDDYPQFLLASCRHWDRDRKGAYELCVNMLDERNWTITQDRAAFTAANLSWYIADEKVMKDGMALLRTVAESKRDNPYVNRARLVLGMRLINLGEIREGAKWLKRVPGKDSGYRIVARRYLEALEKYREAAKNENRGG